MRRSSYRSMAALVLLVTMAATMSKILLVTLTAQISSTSWSVITSRPMVYPISFSSSMRIFSISSPVLPRKSSMVLPVIFFPSFARIPPAQEASCLASCLAISAP